MSSQRNLFIATALIEVVAGVSLVLLPALAIRLVLGVETPSAEALAVGRLGGVALLAIGVACWLARDDRGSRSQHGLLWGMLTYNVGACAVLASAGSLLRMSGVGLWPAVVLHAALTVWCVAKLRVSGADA